MCQLSIQFNTSQVPYSSSSSSQSRCITIAAAATCSAPQQQLQLKLVHYSSSCSQRHTAMCSGFTLAAHTHFATTTYMLLESPQYSFR